MYETLLSCVPERVALCLMKSPSHAYRQPIEVYTKRNDVTNSQDPISNTVMMSHIQKDNLLH